MSKTSEFMWDFGSGGTRDRNSASSAALNFSAAGRYISFVRESIQNSLDFPLNINAPVEMTFSLSEISSEDYPELFELGDHIRDCKEISIENPRAHKEYTAMERRFFPNGTQVGTLKVLTVSDYNTLGMYYDTTNEKSKVASPFYCFALSEGSSRKFGPGPAGGSFGFGKNAYFSMSPFKTLIVSTKVGEGAFKGRQFMLGVSALISHLHEGKKVSDYGCFGVKTNPLEPVSDVNMIPGKFRRDRPGTDMHIIGTYGETDHEIFTNLKRAVLNHFWLAILDKKLEVTVGGEKITAENLSEVIQKTFNSEVETGWASNYDGWCPILEILERADGSSETVEYVWGRDLSGSLQGAGGVGGLLYMKRNGAVYVPLYDAYGNVCAYADSTGAVAVAFAYDAFGNDLAEHAPGEADAFRFRYSTKWYEEAAGLYGYGKRFYSPEFGRWLSRDPLGEASDANLYRFCENAPTWLYDAFGELTKEECDDHYCDKTGTPLSLPFSEIDTSSVRPEDFPAVQVYLAVCGKGTHAIRYQSQSDNHPFSTTGAIATVLGDVTLKLEGTLEIRPSGDWTFDGTLKCFDDEYDFRMDSRILRDIRTLAGRPWSGGKSFLINIHGSKHLTGSGNCCDFRKTSAWWL